MYKNKLKKLRTEKNLKQKDISTILGLSEISYTNYENEYYIMPINYLNIIANYYCVSLDYILGLNYTLKYNDNSMELDSIKSGERIRMFRKENKITQEKLANCLNTNRSVIANYERGRNLIATPFLYTICQKYKISADYLLGKTDNPKYLD